jgi:hypothetical protein
MYERLKYVKNSRRKLPLSTLALRLETWSNSLPRMKPDKVVGSLLIFPEDNKLGISPLTFLSLLICIHSLSSNN